MLFGTGAGIAFFFVRAQRTGDVKIIASVGRDVVLADMVFTATAVILQPISGIALALMAGFPFSSRWLALSIALYLAVGVLLVARGVAADSDAGFGHRCCQPEAGAAA